MLRRVLRSAAAPATAQHVTTRSGDVGASSWGSGDVKDRPLSMRAVGTILVLVVAACIAILTLAPRKRSETRPPLFFPKSTLPPIAARPLVLPTLPPLAVEAQEGNATHLADHHAAEVRKRSPDATVLKPVPASKPPVVGTDPQVVIFTTVKPCDSDAIFDAQIAAVASWAALPLNPPPVIYIIDTEQHIDEPPNPRTCAQLIADLVPAAKSLVAAAATSSHGTVLLGGAIRVIKDLEPNAALIGFINADIILAPTTAAALRTASEMFTEVFLVGRRRTVDLRAESVRRSVMPVVVASRAGKLTPVPDDTSVRDPFNTASWFASDTFHRAIGDRIDAEDYFFFTRNFFNVLPYNVPDFHIGRPAYDNWLVHTALHSLQPVVDASGAIGAYHQSHDYRHLGQTAAGEGPPPNNQPAAGKGAWTYWGSADQKANYHLGETHGGWRHGLIEFAPLHFVRPAAHGVGTRRDRDAAEVPLADVDALPGLTASETCGTAAPAGTRGGVRRVCLAIALKPTWKPLANEDGDPAKDAVTLADLGLLGEALTKSTRPGAPRRLWLDTWRLAVKQRRNLHES